MGGGLFNPADGGLVLGEGIMAMPFPRHVTLSNSVPLWERRGNVGTPTEQALHGALLSALPES